MMARITVVRALHADNPERVLPPRKKPAKK